MRQPCPSLTPIDAAGCNFAVDDRLLRRQEDRNQEAGAHAMDLKDRIIVITGAASGIGRALAQRFHKEGAKLIVCSDIDGAGAEETARSVAGVAFRTDVAKEADIVHLIDTVEKDHGPIDLFCS